MITTGSPGSRGPHLRRHDSGYDASGLDVRVPRGWHEPRGALQHPLAMHADGTWSARRHVPPARSGDPRCGLRGIVVRVSVRHSDAVGGPPSAVMGHPARERDFGRGDLHRVHAYHASADPSGAWEWGGERSVRLPTRLSRERPFIWPVPALLFNGADAGLDTNAERPLARPHAPPIRGKAPQVEELTEPVECCVFEVCVHGGLITNGSAIKYRGLGS